LSGRYAQEYRKIAVHTASPVDLIVMLYDGALRFIELGRAALERGDHFEKNERLQRAQRIVTELMSCLDMARGGEVAQNLFALYSYVYNLLVESNIRDEVGKLEEAKRILAELRESWAEIARGERTQGEVENAAA
jgi:flagellar protein FliS